LLALLLGFLGVASSVVYVVVLQKMNWTVRAVMIASELMVMAAIYLVIVKRWRRDRRT